MRVRNLTRRLQDTSIMGAWMMMICRRWRMMLWIALFVVILLNMFAFIDVSNSNPGSLQPSNKLTKDVSHLQNKARTSTNGSRRANYSIPAVDKFVMKFQLRYTNNSLLKLDPRESYNDFLRRLNLRRKKGKPLVQNVRSPANNSAEKYHRGIKQFNMYDPDDDSIQALLQDLVTLPIVSTEVVREGSQLKFQFTFADGSKARFKPMRQTVDRTNQLNTCHMDFFEKHHAEIAGFHLDRYKDQKRTAQTAVYKMNNIFGNKALSLDARKGILDVGEGLDDEYNICGNGNVTGNLCFIIRCTQYCGQDYPFCGHGDALPGALSAGLPSWMTYYRHVEISPYKRSYALNKKRNWETNEDYCNSFVKKNVSFHTLLEFMDLSAYDFLTGNQDRHTHQKFQNLGDETFVIVFDNARGFSQPTYDHMLILTPIRQCCLIRLSTLAKFIKLYKGPDSLGQLMASSLNSDPLSEILTEADLDALDRRVGKVIKTVGDCVAKAKSWDDVVFDDLNIRGGDM